MKSTLVYIYDDENWWKVVRKTFVSDSVNQLESHVFLRLHFVHNFLLTPLFWCFLGFKEPQGGDLFTVSRGFFSSNCWMLDSWQQVTSRENRVVVHKRRQTNASTVDAEICGACWLRIWVLSYYCRLINADAFRAVLKARCPGIMLKFKSSEISTEEYQHLRCAVHGLEHLPSTNLCHLCHLCRHPHHAFELGTFA